MSWVSPPTHPYNLPEDVWLFACHVGFEASKAASISLSVSKPRRSLVWSLIVAARCLASFFAEDVRW